MRYKDKSKRECILAIRRINYILNGQLKKKAAEQDRALISECIDALLFFRHELDSIRSAEKAQERRSAHFSLGAFARPMRKSVLIPLCVVILLIVSATVAQAAGLRVWSALIHMDADYLRVDYSKGTDSPSSDDEGAYMINRLNFSTESDMLDSFSKLGILYPDALNGYRFISASVDCTGNTYRSVRISLVDEARRDLLINVRLNGSDSNNDKSYYSVWYGGQVDEYIRQDISGIEFTYIVGREYTAVTFATDRDVYELCGSISLDELEAIVASMF